MSGLMRGIAGLLFALALSSPSAFGQAGLVRSQTNVITHAIQNEVREATRSILAAPPPLPVAPPPAPAAARVRLPPRPIQPHLVVNNTAGAVTSLALSSDSRLLAVVYNNTALRIWDLQNGVEQARYNSKVAVRALRIGSGVQQAVIGTEAGTLLVLDAATGAPLATLNGHQGAVSAIGMSHDGSAIVSASADGTIRLWDARAGREQGGLHGQPGVAALAVTADGKRVAAGLSRGGVILWDGTAGAPTAILHCSSPGIIAVGFDDVGRVIGVGSDGAIHIWDADGAGTPNRSFRPVSQAKAAEISDDGRAVALAFSETQTAVVEMQSARVLRKIGSDPGFARSLAVDLDRKRLFTGGGDGFVRIWNVESGEPLAQIISTVKGWAALDRQGRFDGTPVGVQEVRWLTVKQTLPVDNFSTAYFEPGLIAKYMRDQASFVAPAQTAVAAGIRPPPQVTVAVPPGPYAGGAKVEVTVRARDQGGGIGAIRLFQNGKLVPADRQTGGQKQKTRITRIYQAALVAGTNQFMAVAANHQQIDGEPGQARITASGSRALPNLDVVVIGVNHYQDAQYDLDYGASDALAILQQFDQASAGVFNRTVAYQLTDETATRANIIEMFTALQRIAPEDVLVIYLAGHGTIIGDEWYWLPEDATFTADGIPRTGISATTLRDLLSRVGPERVFVMIDSCNSGGSVDPLATSMDRRVLRSVGRDTGVAILAAARRDQSAAELSHLGHGAFTYVVLEGLAGKADATHSGEITASNLITYSSAALPSLTKSIANHLQIPVAYSRGEDFQIAR